MTAPKSEEEDNASTSVLSRELRDSIESLFDRFRSISLFEISEDDLSLEENFLMLVSRYPEDAMRDAVLLMALETPGASFTGRLPIHMACDNSAPISIVQWLVNSDTTKTSILRRDKWGDIPLHTACSRSGFEDVIKLLLSCDVDKCSIFVKDENGSLPIHMACRYNAGPDVIRLLLESDLERKTLHEEGIYGQLPLHVACRGGASLEAMKILLEYDEQKTSVLKEDNVGRLAIHLYLLSNRNRFRDMDIVKLLLESMICKRLERIGLDLWKKTLHQLLSSLTKSYERDFVTRDRLDSICDEIKMILQRSFLLELAIWKASCLRGNKGSFQCMLDIEEWETSDKTFDACQYKQEMFHLSGADQIIPHVLPFLEDEAIVKLMEELK